MKASVVRIGVSSALITIVTLLSAGTSIDALAQDAQPAPQIKKVSAHTADHRLERSVRKALSKSKVDSSDIRVVARGNAVTLDGTVPDDSQIALAESIATGVSGVGSVKNMLSLREVGH